MTNTILNVLQTAYPQVPVTSIEGKRLPVAWDKMTVETIAFLAWHGAKQKTNDRLGAKDMSNVEKLATAQKVVDALEANIIRMGGERETYLVAVELTALVNARLKAEFKGQAKPDAAAWAARREVLRGNATLQGLAEQAAALKAGLADLAL